jgi:hypothetical protein
MIDEKEWRDPIVAEVRAARDRLAEQCNYDVAAIFKHLRVMEEEGGAKGGIGVLARGIGGVSALDYPN